MNLKDPSSSAVARKPKHQELFERLRAAIHDGQYAPGDRLPTEAELVEHFNVSRTTVNRALRDLQNEGMLTRRRGSGTYIPNSKRDAVSTAMWFLLPTLEDGSLFLTVQRVLAREAESLGWSMSVRELPPDMDKREASGIVDSMVNRGADGLFYLPHAVNGPPGQLNTAVIEAFENRTDAPLVLLDRDIVSFPQRSPYDLVSSDNQRGGHLIADHLISRGCHRIIFLLDEDDMPSSSARFEGYRLAMQQHGKGPAVSVSGDPDSREFVQSIMRDHKPDGIICDSDYDAARVMRQLLNMGTCIPDDVRLAGFDDTPTAALLPVPLTTVRQNVQGIVSWAITIMASRIDGPDQPACRALIDCELVVRESTGKP